jgi:outer membrane murein-binding lipoprotein Lpp
VTEERLKMSDLDPWGNPIGNVSKSDLANQINSNLIQLNAHMNKLEEYYNTLGTQKENSTIRAEITRLRLVCRDLIKQTKDHFAQMENNEKKEQLLKNFNDFLYKYEQLSQKAMRRETEILQVMESSARGTLFFFETLSVVNVNFFWNQTFSNRLLIRR